MTIVRQSNFYSATRIPGSGGREKPCRVYWGSHGCMLDRGHDGEHLCTCTFSDGVMLPHMDVDPEFGNVGRAPYYGPETSFYGEDAEGPSDEPDDDGSGYLVSFEIVTEQRNPKAHLHGITEVPAGGETQ